MKRSCFVLLVFISFFAHAQNEFANTRFTEAFRKLYADAPNGFATSKGNKHWALGSFYTIHKSLIVLPGADSAIVSVPVAYGHPSASQYFKTSASMAMAWQRENELLTAIKAHAGKTLYEKTAVDSAGKFVFYRTRLFKNPSASLSDIDMETYIVLDKGRYHLVLTIHGTNPPPAPTGKSKLPAEADLQGSINSLFAMLPDFFASNKGELESTTEYYSTYKTKSRLFGQTGEIKERKFETSIRFSLNGGQLDGPAEAKQVYEKLKAAFTATNRCRFNPEKVEGSRTWLYASDAANNAIHSKFSLVLEYYNDPYNPSVGFLLTAKR